MTGPRIELISVGSELLAGQLNTHQRYLALALQNAGLKLNRENSLPDEIDALSQAVREALTRCDALLVSGGLGPTFDDLTRDAVSHATKRKLVYKAALFKQIERRLVRYYSPVPEQNKRQAFVLHGARVLANPHGSAPGQLLILPRHDQSPQTIALLPGPFAELGPMFSRYVLPHLKRTYTHNQSSASLCVHMSGVPESVADAKLTSVMAKAKNKKKAKTDFTILASSMQVDFYASVRTATAAQARAALKQIHTDVYDAVGEHIFGEGDTTLEAAVGEKLKTRHLTLAIAESCTGGLMGGRITAVAGSSQYFLGGVEAYHNDLKQTLLKVPSSILHNRTLGAVSPECARAMADGVRQLTGASIGVSITGIAGPGGASQHKPVGLIYFGFSGPNTATEAVSRRFSGGREQIRQRATAWALHLLLRRLS